jgi:16S rRNA processing protein RimM
MGTTEPEYIIIGQVLAPWGNKGRVKVKATTDFPQRFAPSSQVYINRQPVTIDSAEWHKGRVIIKISTVDSIEEARKLRGQTIEIHRSQLKPLPEGHYYLFQIIGLMVSTTQGEPLGKITEVFTTKGNDTYVVNGDRGEILIPAIEDVVKSIDLEQGRMVIDPIEGLLSLNQKATD